MSNLGDCIEYMREIDELKKNIISRKHIIMKTKAEILELLNSLSEEEIQDLYTHTLEVSFNCLFEYDLQKKYIAEYFDKTQTFLH
jgi:uncharacterized membrane-anchored protein YhcB (DUF1043 family)